MGPGPRGPGNKNADGDGYRVGPLQWGRDRAVPEISRAIPPTPPDSPLQWGRDRAVPEIWRDPKFKAEKYLASMGPGPRGPGNSATAALATADLTLQWGRDRAVPEMEKPMGELTAAKRLQWGRDRAVPEIDVPPREQLIRVLASMGPGPRGPGNRATFASVNRTWMLQWGRDRAVPEMLTALNPSRCTRPLQWGRDRAVPEIPGPDVPPRNEDQLQWGRDRAVPEIERGGLQPARRTGLQWGRDRAVPEIRAWRFRPAETHGFNGAGTARSRKLWGHVYGTGGMAASMGPGPRGPGNVSYGLGANSSSDASMGPGPRGPGNRW